MSVAVDDHGAVTAAPFQKRSWLSLERAALVALLVAAVAAWLAAPTYPNYDSYYHLVWGRELLDGVKPTFAAFAAPTEHPLFIALGGVLGAVFGESADRVLVLVCLLAHVALIAAVYTLGKRAFNGWCGLFAALFVAVSASLTLYAFRGYVDSLFLALVFWAAALAAPVPRRTALPFTLLILAGLLRPEAWVLIALFWLWVCWSGSMRQRITYTVGAALAPAIWAITDYLVTGDPLYSLNSTTELADSLHRVRGIDAVPGAFVTFLSEIVRLPVAALGLVGLLLAIGFRRQLRTRIPVALLASGSATFLAVGAFGLSIIPRYLTVTAVALCLFAGFGVAGFTLIPRGTALRRNWMILSLVSAVVGCGFMAVKAPSITRVTDELSFTRKSHQSLVAVLDNAEVQKAMKCGRLTFPTYRLIPDARWHLDLPRFKVSTRAVTKTDRGVAVFTNDSKTLHRFGLAAGVSPNTNTPDPDFNLVAQNSQFAAYARCTDRGT